MPPKRQQKAKYWIFTHNNPEHALDVVFADLHAKGDLVYAIWQLEIGESGTLHHQGFIQLHKSQRLSYVSAIEDTAHWEMARAPSDAQGYCCKEDTRIDGPYTIGVWVPPKPGCRTDLTGLYDAVKSGKDDAYLAENHLEPFIKYQRGILALRACLSPKRAWTTELIVLLGKPGTGKTTLVTTAAPLLPNFTGLYHKSTNEWWDMYGGESDVLLDDFYGWIPFHFMLRLCDFPPLLLNIKGGSAQLLARRVWITSNKLPNAWWKQQTLANYDFTALERRITKVIYFENIDTQHTYTSYKDFIDDQKYTQL